MSLVFNEEIEQKKAINKIVRLNIIYAGYSY